MPKSLKLLLAGLIAFAVFYTALHLLREQEFSPGSDEGYYYSYAQQVSSHGIEVLPKLIDQYFSDPQGQRYPPPTRLGYVLTTALLFKWYPSYWTLGLFSFICFILFLGVHMHFCRRHFGEKIALLSTVLLAASPLLLAMSRRALMDSGINLLFCSSVWLFLDYIVRRKKHTYILFLTALFLSLMFKESAVVLLPFFVIAGWLFPGGHKLKWTDLWGVAATVLAAGLIVPGALVGYERWWGTLVKVGNLQHSVFIFNPYVADYCSGPWYRYLIDAVLLSPLTVLLFIGYVFHALLRPNMQFNVQYFLLYFFITYVQMVPLQKNIRYVIGLQMVIMVFASLMTVELVSRFISSSRRDWWAVMLITALFLLDYNSFINIFVQWGVLDPISAHLLSYRNIIP